MQHLNTTTVLKTLSISALALAISACGSSGSSNSTDNSNSNNGGGDTVTQTLPSVILGSITAVDSSSIDVNGYSIAASSAEVEVDDIDTTLSALKTGMMVKVNTNGSYATEIDYDPNFKGPVSLSDSGVFIAGTQLVNIDQAQLSDGDVLEVSGYSSAANTLSVTYFAPLTDVSDLEVEGEISQLDTQSYTFQLGDLVINYRYADVEGTLSLGQYVDVDGYIENGVFVAQEVDTEQSSDFEQGVQSDLEGVISWVNSDASLMTINQQWQVQINAQTQFEDGTQAQLIAGAYVDVDATWDQTQQLFVATEVDFESEQNSNTVTDQSFALSGLATYTNGVITINGLSFTLSANTVFDDGLTQSTLDGQWLELEGTLSGDTARVLEVELDDDQLSIDLKGTVSSTDTQGATLWGYVAEDASLDAYVGQYVDLECQFVSANVVRACVID